MGAKIFLPFLLLSLIVLWDFRVVVGRGEEGEGREEEHGGRGSEGGDLFILRDSKQVIKTEAGEVRVMMGAERGVSSPMNIGFINMEPESLFVPQYLDAALILFVRRGSAKIGWINRDDLVEKELRIGDVYSIPAGSPFYLVNIGEGQRLQIICSIDTSERIGHQPFQSFILGGGRGSVLSGFNLKTLSTAFNVSTEELSSMLGRPSAGPIIYMTGAHEPPKAFSLIKPTPHRVVEEEEEEIVNWGWRKLMKSVFGEENKAQRHTTDSYNLYKKKPDFRNKHGWSIALDHHDYSPLAHSDIGVYLVNLTAGAMMAPHMNPIATEYGIVLQGMGNVQVVFPNGSLAMDTNVKEGDAFWIPRYFPFCQIASRSGPMEFFGFTTSAQSNRPQFLVGPNSVLNLMRGPELATAFNLSPDELRTLTTSQKESVILPETIHAPPHGKSQVRAAFHNSATHRDM
ncbi:hypothetical protein AMTRI_Chr08g206130 [Amborella trichopoda]|uniref:Cupin type-1 domain-containing protein n=1 Tax=Amborella trichopoda TaxID=13333 RepID=W1PB84_AMBTC|nr:vicilin-like seed storage protein At2g28490 [Amborella trichopoda]ERN04969.1 hypothetical protein AMTR_s00080p00163630 [Amborella trichopoda]|eukprot:XP_006843294.1 vicilin-like seed storage protein At2g28490 [Amborella trichopoda]